MCHTTLSLLQCIERRRSEVLSVHPNNKHLQAVAQQQRVEDQRAVARKLFPTCWMAVVVGTAKALRVLDAETPQLRWQLKDVLHDEQALVVVHGENDDDEKRKQVPHDQNAIGSKGARIRTENVVDKQDCTPTNGHQEQEVAHPHWHHLDGFSTLLLPW